MLNQRNSEGVFPSELKNYENCPTLQLEDYFLSIVEFVEKEPDVAFRTDVMYELNALRQRTVIDRHGMLTKYLARDISGRALIFQNALQNKHTYGELMDMMFAMMGTIDPTLPPVTKVPGWPLEAMPNVGASVCKQVNAHVRNLLLCRGGAATHGGYITHDQCGVNVYVGHVYTANNSVMMRPMARKPSAAMDVTEMYFTTTEEEHHSPYFRTIGCLGKPSSMSTPPPNISIVDDMGFGQFGCFTLQITFHPVRYAVTGLPTVRLMAMPATVYAGQTFTVSAIFDKAGYENAVGVLVTARAVRGAGWVCGGGFNESRVLPRAVFVMRVHHGTSETKAAAHSDTDEVTTARRSPPTRDETNAAAVDALIATPAVATADGGGGGGGRLVEGVSVHEHQSLAFYCGTLPNTADTMTPAAEVFAPVVRQYRQWAFRGAPRVSIVGRKATRAVCALLLTTSRNGIWKFNQIGTAAAFIVVDYTIHPIMPQGHGGVAVRFINRPTTVTTGERVCVEDFRVLPAYTGCVGLLVVARHDLQCRDETNIEMFNELGFTLTHDY